jgi:hypothetical protein
MAALVMLCVPPSFAGEPCLGSGCVGCACGGFSGEYCDILQADATTTIPPIKQIPAAPVKPAAQIDPDCPQIGLGCLGCGEYRFEESDPNPYGYSTTDNVTNQLPFRVEFLVSGQAQPQCTKEVFQIPVTLTFNYQVGSCVDCADECIPAGPCGCAECPPPPELLQTP